MEKGFEILKSVSIGGSPCNAQDYVKIHADIVTDRKGSEGAFREFVEKILTNEGKLEYVLSLYFDSLHEFKQ